MNYTFDEKSNERDAVKVDLAKDTLALNGNDFDIAIITDIEVSSGEHVDTPPNHQNEEEKEKPPESYLIDPLSEAIPVYQPSGSLDDDTQNSELLYNTHTSTSFSQPNNTEYLNNLNIMNLSNQNLSTDTSTLGQVDDAITFEPHRDSLNSTSDQYDLNNTYIVEHQGNHTAAKTTDGAADNNVADITYSDPTYTAFNLAPGEKPEAFEYGKEMQKMGYVWDDFSSEITQRITITEYTDEYSMGTLSTAHLYSGEHVGTIHSVSNADELYDVLNSIQGDTLDCVQTILLEAGMYNDVYLNNYNFSDEIIIKSSDPDNPAVFASLRVNNSENLSFDSIRVEIHIFEDSSISKGFNFTNSSDITLINSEIQGSDDEVDLNNGTGLSVTDSSGITIQNNDMHDLKNMISLDYSEDIVIDGNHIHHFIEDGVGIKSIDGLVFSNNVMDSVTTPAYFFDPETGIYYTSYERPTETSLVWDYAHSDYIQFNLDHRSQNNDTVAPVLTKNVTISDNSFLYGDSFTSSQVIYNGWLGKTKNQTYIQNHPLSDDDNIWQTNINITGNYIETGNDKAIVMDGVDGGEITNNQIVYIDDNYNGSNPTISLDTDSTFNITLEDNLRPTKSYDNLNEGELVELNGNFLYSQDANDNISLVDYTDIYTDSGDRPYNVDIIQALDLSSLFLFFETEDLQTQFSYSDLNIYDEIITGTSDDDFLYGGEGNDLIFSGSGYDTLSGGLGADTFVITQDVSFDTISDFSASEGDIIDLSDLLENYDALSDDITDFINFTFQGSEIVAIQIDSDGNGDDFNTVLHINSGDMDSLDGLISADQIIF